MARNYESEHTGGLHHEMSMGAQMDCNNCWESGVQKDYIELSHEDVREMKSISNAARLQGQMDEHLRTAPINKRDASGLRSHLESLAHIESTHPDMSLADLQAIHDDSHAESDAGREDERIYHTTIGNNHFHH